MTSAAPCANRPLADGQNNAARTARLGARRQERKHLWKQLAQYVGSDVMSLLSIPVWLMEPLSTLQKMSEITEFMHCLARADDSDDESVRCAIVAAFACGAYASVKRTYKPFNPILGETFEVALPDGAVYLAEQVRARR
jgi:hypothetical protein